MSSLFIQTLTQKLPQRILAKLGFGKNMSASMSSSMRKQSTRLSCVNELILSKFEACLLGALIGDCIGRKFEGIWGPNLDEMLDDYRLLREKLEHEAQFNMLNSNNSNNVGNHIMAGDELHHHFGGGGSSFESYLSGGESNKRPYSDDTVLTRALCDSFINCQGEFDIVNVADEFEAAYSCEPHRGYSSCSIVLFKKLNKLKQIGELEKRCLQPAMELFNGEGSYGNGGGMRCSAIALFTYAKSVEEMRVVCELSTRLTHTHKWAVIGALQQCYALRLALETTKSWRTFDFDAFYTAVVGFVHELERHYDSASLDLANPASHAQQHLAETCSKSTRQSLQAYVEQKNELCKARKSKHHHHHHHHRHLNTGHNSHNGANNKSHRRHHHHRTQTHTYSKLMRKLKRLLKSCRAGGIVNTPKLYKQIASYGIPAVETIPLALFAFMVASDVRCANELSAKLNSCDPFGEFSPIERVLFYAISLGGETNKVASMAAALAGAFYSSKDLPRFLADMCEGANDAVYHAQKLFDFVAASTPLSLLQHQQQQQQQQTQSQQHLSVLDLSVKTP